LCCSEKDSESSLAHSETEAFLWHAETKSEVQVSDFFLGIEIGDSILQTRKKMENGESKLENKAELT
jgi:hypothetical protein